jgi:UDP-2,3-diacylglucosamine hydrolase
MRPQIGLIAGEGQFPFIVARAAKEQGLRVVAVAIKEETSPELSQSVDRIYWLHIGELGKLIRAFRGEGITKTVMAGKVQKKHLFSQIKPDLRATLLYMRLKEKNDDAILKGIDEELRGEGIEVVACTSIISDLLAPRGVLTSRSPSQWEQKDIEFGKRMARAIAGLDIGQTVVVKNQIVLAVEAIEGTNLAIARGAEWGGEGSVVVKVARPEQDMRFDVPVVGRSTLEVMREVKASVLALEAEKVIILEKEEMLSLAEEAKISIVAD